MRAIIQRERIRIIPVPEESKGVLWIWLKKPLTEGHQPFVHTEVEANRKFYDLPCPLDNIMGVTIKKK